MRNITENLGDSTRGSRLYCVWVPVRDHGDRLVAIWIDPAMTGFKLRAPESSDGIGKAATHFAVHQEENVDQFAGEPLASILPRLS